MPQRKSISLYRKNLLPIQKNSGQQEYWLYSYSEFNRNGNQIEQTVYTQDGSMVERTLKEYNAGGFVIREKYFAGEDEAAEEKSYDRNENGLILKEFKHYLDGSYDTTTYEYDSQNRILSRITQNDEGETEQKTIHEYRDDFLVKSQVFDGDGNLLQSDEFKYDEKGNSVEHKRVDNETAEESFIVTSYNSNGRKRREERFDEDGDLISQSVFDENGKGQLVKITETGSDKNITILFRYDENGNAIEQEELDEEGNQLVLVKRAYDEVNNLVHSEVFIDGQGLTLPQHYEIKFEYEFHPE